MSIKISEIERITTRVCRLGSDGRPAGRWLPARPGQFYSIGAWLHRWVDALGVITGRYDALDWEE